MKPAKLGQIDKNSFQVKNILVLILVAGILGFLLGIANLWILPTTVLVIIGGIVFIYFALKYPAIGLLGIVVATSSIVFENQLPVIPFLGISLHIPDLLLIGLLALVAIRWAFEPGFKFIHTPLDWPLLLFLVLIIFSTLFAVYQKSVDVETARRAIRIIAYYSTFYIVTNLVRDRLQLDLLWKGIILLATIVSIVMVGQFVLGGSMRILPGRVETLWTQGITFTDVTRIAPPGLSIVVVSFVTIICILVIQKHIPGGVLIFFQSGVLAAAIMVTFLRSYWATLIGVIVLLLLLVRKNDRKRLIGWGLVVLSVAIIALPLIINFSSPRVDKQVSAVMNRLSTLMDNGTYTGQDSSLNWRLIENQYAISTIASQPLIGIGMGAKYRPYDRRIASDPTQDVLDFRTFIHNGHLGLILDSGLIGYLCFIVMSVLFMARGFLYWQTIHDDLLKAIMLGYTLTYLAVFVAAIVNSTFTQWRWTPVLGIVMGINEVILLQSRAE